MANNWISVCLEINRFLTIAFIFPPTKNNRKLQSLNTCEVKEPPFWAGFIPISCPNQVDLSGCLEFLGFARTDTAIVELRHRRNVEEDVESLITDGNMYGEARNLSILKAKRLKKQMHHKKGR